MKTTGLVICPPRLLLRVGSFHVGAGKSSPVYCWGCLCRWTAQCAQDKTKDYNHRVLQLLHPTRITGAHNKTFDFICFILVPWAELSWAVTIIFFFLFSTIFLKSLLNLKWCYCLLKYAISVLLMCICKLLCFEMHLQIYKPFTHHMSFNYWGNT